MYWMIRRTRACRLEALDEMLKAAIRTHAAQYELIDVELDILMCCETISVHPKPGRMGGIKTTLSAVYVTPKWLVWVDSSGRNDADVTTAQLKDIEVSEAATARFAITPDQGLNIIGHYTNQDRSGATFIVLSSEGDGQEFRRVLAEAWSKAPV